MESDSHENPVGIKIAIWVIRGMGIKHQKNFMNLYIPGTKLQLNRAVPVPVRRILTIPPWDTKLNSSGGVRSSNGPVPLQIPHCPY